MKLSEMSERTWNATCAVTGVCWLNRKMHERRMRRLRGLADDLKAYGIGADRVREINERLTKVVDGCDD